MSCPKTQVVRPGEVVIVHLTNALPGTEYSIQYAVGSDASLPAERFGEVRPSAADGLGLRLTPETTPLVLNLPGVYRFLLSGGSGGLVHIYSAIRGEIPRGDVV